MSVISPSIAKIQNVPKTSAPRPQAQKEPLPAPAQDTVDLQPQPQELVKVGHTRELRGAWVATVFNINFPSSPNTSAETQKREMAAMLDRLQECGFNAIFFQVRPEGDALYRSSLEPWSSSLTGTQGKDPGYDPLQLLVSEAHKRNIEVHAWLNPFRASAAAKQQVSPHVAVDHPEHVHQYGSTKWMDPAGEVVRDRLVDVCKDLTRRYDLDGIHFDDYFYPYPNGTDFPDDATWKQYVDSGGKMSRADWRRENVNRTVREVGDAIRGEKDHVRFGISPFGIPAPKKPPGIVGFDQYEGLYADTQKWMDEGLVDYLAPQLYWPTTKPQQAYGTLVKWWSEHTSGGRYIFAGNNLADLGKPQFPVSEFRKQLALSREQSDKGCKGQIWWHVGPIMENRQNIVRTFRDEFYKEPALSPALSSAAGKTVAHPQVSQEGPKVQLKHQDSAPLRAWTVYQKEGRDWKLHRVLPATENQVELPKGEWAIAATSLHGVESQGVVVRV